MLTGTDCAGKCNKPRAAGIHLHHRDRGPGSRMCEAPTADIFLCQGTKYIRLQTGTVRRRSTRLRFHPGGTGGPGTAARPFGTAGRAGATYSNTLFRGDRQSTHNTKGESKQASHHRIPLPILLSVCLCMLPVPCTPFLKMLDLTPRLAVPTHATERLHHPVAYPQHAKVARPALGFALGHPTRLTPPARPFAPQRYCASPGAPPGAIASIPGHRAAQNVLDKLVPAPALLTIPCSTATSPLRASKQRP